MEILRRLLCRILEVDEESVKGEVREKVRDAIVGPLLSALSLRQNLSTNRLHSHRRMMPRASKWVGLDRLDPCVTKRDRIHKCLDIHMFDLFFGS